jgi:hypothetical protein
MLRVSNLVVLSKALHRLHSCISSILKVRALQESRFHTPDRMSGEAQRLVESGHLLAEDLELLVDQASRRYEILLEHKRESLTVSN